MRKISRQVDLVVLVLLLRVTASGKSLPRVATSGKSLPRRHVLTDTSLISITCAIKLILQSYIITIIIDTFN